MGLTKKTEWSDLWKKEDWLACWIGFIIIAIGCVAVLTGCFDFSALKFSTWSLGEKAATKAVPLGQQLGEWVFWRKLIVTVVTLGVLFAAGVKAQGEKIGKFIPAFLVLFVLAVVVRLVSAEFTLNRYLEWAFWALIVGLLVSNTVGVPEWLKPAVRTEFYIKTGLVIMGFSVLFSNIAKFGLYGLGIAWIVTPIVILFMWWLGTKLLKIDNRPLVITIATATSVCGTSAAIAAAAASRARKTDLAFAVGTSLIFTVVMMVGMPLFIQAIGLDPLLGGAWIGGTVDSTGAVVLAGQALGDLGGVVAALVKMIQNILIGFIAFGIAIFFSYNNDFRTAGSGALANGSRNVGAGEIWQRFPKFILGFIVASLVFSFVLQPTVGADTTASVIKHLGQFKNWAFALAFTSIGLETNFKELGEQMRGGKPVLLYVIGQLFNIVLTFAAVWLLLSGRLFPVPEIDL